jgi:predicted RNase H-like HicB family nuclease
MSALHARRVLRIETEREVDNRWIAEVPALTGVMAYGATESEAVDKAKALASGSLPTGGSTANRSAARFAA